MTFPDRERARWSSDPGPLLSRIRPWRARPAHLAADGVHVRDGPGQAGSGCLVLRVERQRLLQICLSLTIVALEVVGRAECRENTGVVRMNRKRPTQMVDRLAVVLFVQK